MPLAQRDAGAPSLVRVRINFSWILKLRWAAAAGQLATIAFVQFGLGVPLPLYALFLILAAEAFSNLLLDAWFRGLFRRDVGPPRAALIEAALTSIMSIDIVLLTLLLFLTGGPTNPFSVFYFVNVVLAAVVLRPASAWALAGLALLGYGTLFLVHVPLPELAAMRSAAQDGGARSMFFAGRLSLFLKGLLAAVAMAVGVIVWFVTRLTAELAAREGELADERARIARAERLEALGTLAAGAAHELASPLSTIAVVARDLEVLLARAEPDTGAADDARLIRREVDRCRAILDQMAADAGQSRGEAIVPTSAQALLDAALDDLQGRERIARAPDAALAETTLRVPLRAVSLALRQVLKNALDASRNGAAVEVRVEPRGADVVIAVTDHGEGMSAETAARAAEPFFTTKEPGKGMGLGLFLARTVLERLGGRLEFDSVPGEGTTVRLVLPAG